MVTAQMFATECTYMLSLYTAPADYIAVTSNVTLSASERIVKVSVDIVDDEAVELKENFFLRIAVIGGLADAVELVQDETQVIIMNDDGNKLILTIHKHIIFCIYTIIS